MLRDVLNPGFLVCKMDIIVSSSCLRVCVYVLPEMVCLGALCKLSALGKGAMRAG